MAEKTHSGMRKTLWTLIPLVVVFLVLLFLMPKAPKFNYDYKKGDTWRYETLIAEFDFPVLKTEEQLIKERESISRVAVPYFTVLDDVPARVGNKLKDLDFGFRLILQENLLSSVEELYKVGVLPDNKPRVESDKNYRLSEDVLSIVRDKKESRLPYSEVYTISSAKAKLRSELVSSLPFSRRADSLLLASGVLDILEPSLQFDPQMTDLAYTEAPNTISPTMGYRNAQEVLITSGETVTGELLQVLDSYREEYDRKVSFDGPAFLFWLGNGIVALAIVALLYLSILFTAPSIFEERNKFIYLLTIFLLTTVVMFVVSNLGSRYLYMVPFTLTALYLVSFFPSALVLPFYTVSLLPLFIFAHGGMELFVMFLVAGAVTILIFKHFSRGWRQFITAGIVFLVLVVVYLGFRVMQTSSQSIPVTILYLALGSFLSVAGYPLIYLFEIVFNLVSNSRLEELCDTSGKALRELSAKAPGTFQHCLQVMNMADAATRAIGGDTLLVRTGALYHDLGKMLNPLCFIENEGMAPAGPKYHEGRTPKESATHIIRHVTDGAALADKYHLPKVVKDFILSHHGTSSTGYFYNQYINAGGDPADADEFFYPGPRPKTKEQTILMLCDTVEAASRTIKDTSPEGFSDFVEKMCASKMEAGQFDESDISVKELGIVKATLKEYLIGVYHQRIEYPKRKEEASGLEISK